MIALLASAPAWAHIPVIYITGPDDDWCGVINATVGSDIVMLLPGEYPGPCDIVAKLSDMPGEQTVVQSFDPVDPAIFVGSSADYVLDVSGISLLLMQLEFQDLPPTVTAVRVGEIGEFWGRYLQFRDVEGAAIVQTGDAEQLFVTDSAFTDVGQAIRVGCGDGTCRTPALDVADNLVVGAALGLEVARGSWGTVRDNVMTSVGTAIRVSGDPGGEIEVAGGLYEATGPALEVLGGPILARANLVIGQPAVRATGAELVGVRLVGNTLVGELELDGWGPGRDLALISNALLGPPADAGGADLAGTVVCDDQPGACFVDPGAWDFYPAPGSPLRGAGISDGEIGADWCGRVRENPPCAGAIDAFGDLSFGPLSPAFKELLSCALPDPDPTDTGIALTEPDSADTGEPVSPPSATDDLAEDPPGCGCNSGSAGGVLLLLPLLVRTRGPRSARRTG